jgi:spore coat assembly protein SafA
MSSVGAVGSQQTLSLQGSGGGNEVTVQHGDTLSSIAAEHGVSLAALEAANPQINNPNVIYPGQRISIPSGGSHDNGGVKSPSGPTAAGGATPSSTQGRINEAMGYFESQGWTRAQAAGIVGNLQAESGVDPTRGQNGGGPGYGLGQWEAPRQAAFKAWAGHDIHGSTFKEQLQFIQHELTTTEAGAGRALKGATNATDAATIVCNKYERPGIPHLDARIANANAIDKGATPTQPSDGGKPSTGGTTPSKPSTPPTSAGGTVTVKSGDSLSSIAKSHGVSLAALEAANPQIRNPNLIYAGQTVHLPGGATHAAASSNYSVRSGDTLSGIAGRNGISLAALLAANPQIKNANLIYAGQTVHIPGGAGKTNGSAPVSGPTSSGTVKGSDAAAHAKQYLNRYESDLQRAGVTKPCDTSESCANFVSSMLQQSGQINWHTLGVSDLNNRLRAQGWHQVSLADAKPGDVWICNGAHGESHTEIVASNDGHGHVTLIGSNNHPDRNNQQINYDSYSASISGSFILAPP